jgi:hypothetical protein
MISGRLYEYRRMSDQALISYAHNLRTDVEHSTQGEAEWVCPEEEFTRIVLEKLADEGTLDNPSLLYQEGSFGPRIPRTESCLQQLSTPVSFLHGDWSPTK